VRATVSFSIFHRKMPMGTLIFSIGETPSNPHSLSGASYSFMKIFAPGGSVLIFIFTEQFEKEMCEFGITRNDRFCFSASL